MTAACGIERLVPPLSPKIKNFRGPIKEGRQSREATQPEQSAHNVSEANKNSVSVYRGIREEKRMALIPYHEESPGSIEHHRG